MERPDVIIVGGGASGLCAAIGAARCGDKVIVLEKNTRPGKKLLATGNGRCNLMNRYPQPYNGDAEFARQVLGNDPVKELTAFWQELGLMIRYDKEGWGYPSTFLASTVLEVLLAECRRLGVEIKTSTTVSDLRKQENGFLIKTESGDVFRSSRVIIATGGAAQPKLGGNQSAWPWLLEFGHSFLPPEPSLTALITDSRSISGLAGLKIKCSISVETEGKNVHQESGELLFTKTGISGICVMQCSRFVVSGKSHCVIDLFPDLFESNDQLMKDLLRRQRKNPDENPPELFRGLCVSKLAYGVCKQAGLALKGETNKELTESQIWNLTKAAKGYSLKILGKEGFARAQIMSGGLICQDFKPSTLASVLSPGLHATGEILNVDGTCGGYNLMFAFLSGLKAGVNGRRT